MKNETSTNDLTELMQGAVATHEMFTTYVDAGFSRAESLQIVIALLTSAAAQPPQNPQS